MPAEDEPPEEPLEDAPLLEDDPLDAEALPAPPVEATGAADELEDPLVPLVVWAFVEVGAAVEELPVGTVSPGESEVPVPPDPPPQAASAPAERTTAAALARERAAWTRRVTPPVERTFRAAPFA